MVKAALAGNGLVLGVSRVLVASAGRIGFIARWAGIRYVPGVDVVSFSRSADYTGSD